MRSLRFPRLDRPAPDWLTRWTYAHRGLHGPGVPENSLLGARLAIEAGMGIECDVQRSCDDHPMVFHDWELARLTGEEGKTESRTKDELQQLNYIGSNEHPATLAKLLRSEEHTSELQSLMRISYAVFCLKKKKKNKSKTATNWH